MASSGVIQFVKDGYECEWYVLIESNMVNCESNGIFENVLLHHYGEGEEDVLANWSKHDFLLILRQLLTSIDHILSWQYCQWTNIF